MRQLVYEWRRAVELLQAPRWLHWMLNAKIISKIHL